MKRLVAISLAALCAFAFLSGCSSAPQVKRVDSSTQTDLSGYWNDTDVRIVCESLIKDCLDSPRVAQFQTKNGKLPVVIVGNFKNDSDEHIDTSIITKKMETAILNSGKADFVASKTERTDLRDERQEQQGFASEDTAKALANETGADYMLIGSVKTIVDKAGAKSTRTYFVYGELVEIESNKKVWMGENSDIKKVIKTASSKL